MDQGTETALCTAGIDLKTGIERAAGSEALFMKLLKKFLRDENYERFMECAELGDLENARIYIHALKGLCANLSMTDIYEECVRIDFAVKGGAFPENLAALRRNYERIAAALQTLV